MTGMPTRRPTLRAEARDARLLDVVGGLTEGEVVSYGDVAARAGFPKLARRAGRVLRDIGDDVPWWRVVNSAGRLVPGHEDEQATRLRREGVEVEDGFVRAAPAGRFARRGAGRGR